MLKKVFMLTTVVLVLSVFAASGTPAEEAEAQGAAVFFLQACLNKAGAGETALPGGGNAAPVPESGDLLAVPSARVHFGLSAAGGNDGCFAMGSVALPRYPAAEIFLEYARFGGNAPHESAAQNVFILLCLARQPPAVLQAEPFAPARAAAQFSFFSAALAT